MRRVLANWAMGSKRWSLQRPPSGLVYLRAFHPEAERLGCHPSQGLSFEQAHKPEKGGGSGESLSQCPLLNSDELMAALLFVYQLRHNEKKAEFRASKKHSELAQASVSSCVIQAHNTTLNMTVEADDRITDRGSIFPAAGLSALSGWPLSCHCLPATTPDSPRTSHLTASRRRLDSRDLDCLLPLEYPPLTLGRKRLSENISHWLTIILIHTTMGFQGTPCCPTAEWIRQTFPDCLWIWLYD